MSVVGVRFDFASSTVERVEDLAWRFTDFARAFATGAPLYSHFARRVAREPDIIQLMTAAEPMQRIPVLLFASVHYLLLGQPTDPLAQHYPNISALGENRISSGSLDPGPAAGDEFVRFIRQHRDAIAALLETRTTQTNEVGRCNWFLFPLALIERDVGPMARVDIGSSAGLTLLFSLMTFDIHATSHVYGAAHGHPRRMVGDGRNLTLRCDVRGQPPIPEHVPQVVWSVGLDASPIDVRNSDEVRWLEACVWPDQGERFTRLEQAVDLARQHDVRVEVGDAVTNVADFVERAGHHGHPVVTTSWVMNYLSSPQRLDFIAELNRIGVARDLSWIIAESPRETPELPVASHADEDITVISLVTWRNGLRLSRRLATAHPHGSWIKWEA